MQVAALAHRPLNAFRSFQPLSASLKLAQNQNGTCKIYFGFSQKPVDYELTKIDLGDLEAAIGNPSDPQHQATLQAFGKALHRDGFLAITGYQKYLNSNLFSPLHQQAKQLFAQDQTALKQWEVKTIASQRGYYGPKGDIKLQKVATIRKPAIDAKYAWQIGDDANFFMPDEVASGFQNTATQVYKGLRQLGNVVVQGIAEYLGPQYKDRFLSMIQDPAQVNDAHMMRVLYYPAFKKSDIPKGTDKNTLFWRADKHTDMTLFTMQVDPNEKGLQLKIKGKWRFVTLGQDVKDAIIVNLGDSMELITKGLPDGKEMKAKRHRVVATKENVTRDRVASPFFFHTNYHAPFKNIKTDRFIYVDHRPFKTALNYFYHRRVKSGALDPKTVPYQKFKSAYLNKSQAIQGVLRDRGLNSQLINITPSQ